MAKRRPTKEDIAVTPSSGNVFADLGLPEPEEELTKAQLASQLRHILRRRRLTQAQAAALMGIDQPKVSALVNGRLANFSSERLMRLLTALGHDVDVTVSAEPQLHAPGRLRVSAAPAYRIAGADTVTGAPGFSEAESAPLPPVAGPPEGEAIMRYAVVIEKADGNYSAYVPDLPGCVATGPTVAAVANGIRDAIRFHIEGLQADGLDVPQPTSVAEYVEA